MEGKYFKNKYRVQSNRLPGWDYSEGGYYFVTICTKNREEFFGIIRNEKMILNEIGVIVREEWLKTEEVRKNVMLDQWCVMPNHIHGIVIIEYKINNNVETHDHDINNVETHSNASLRGKEIYKNKFGPQINNLSSIIRGFKGATTKQIHKINPYFSWQPRFYDRVIRNEKELDQIRRYIYCNSAKWETDRNNIKNLR